MKRLKLIPPVFLSVFLGIGALSAQTVEVISSTQSVEKGSQFQINVKITTLEAISDIVISPIVPEGFSLYPVSVYGARIISDNMNQKNIITVRVDHLNKGSSLIIPFRAQTPGYFDSPRKRKGDFAFNITYTRNINGAPMEMSQTAVVNIHYTTSIGFYILAGMLGIILGHIVKAGNEKRQVILKEFKNKTSTAQKLLTVPYHIFVSSIPSLLTLLAIGFGALLVLAKESVPVSGWPQAVGLGLALALLTDDKILMKLPKGGS
ncbi:MAG: hypothetical protein ACFFCW_38385 [Candidatus Hodarchaeota archaeon]